jgi:mono/diheme cytochrome c family protein
VFKDIVLKGVLQARGMPMFGDVLDEKQIEQIQAFLLSQAHAAYSAQSKGEAAAAVLREGPH